MKKTCTKCKKEFPATLEYFHAYKPVKCGLRARCKPCAIDDATAYKKTPSGKKTVRKAARKIYQKNKPHLLAKSKKWYDDNCSNILCERTSLYNYTTSEIAEELGLSEWEVRRIIGRGLRKFRDAFKKMYGVPDLIQKPVPDYINLADWGLDE